MRDGIQYKCDEKDENGNAVCNCVAVFKSYKKARAASWGLAKDYITCYCPKHAPAHQKGNAKNGKSAIKKQITLERLLKRGLG